MATERRAGRPQPARAHPRLPGEPPARPPARSSSAWSTTPPPTGPRPSSADWPRGTRSRYHRNAGQRGADPRAQPGRRGSPAATASASCTTTPRCASRAGSSGWRRRWTAPGASGWPASTGCGGCGATAGTWAGRIVHALEGQPTVRGAGGRGGGGGRGVPVPAARDPRGGGRVRRGLRLLPRLRPGSLLRGARGGLALRGGGRALRPPGRGHADRRGRAGGRAGGPGPAPGRAGALRRTSGGTGCRATSAGCPRACAIGCAPPRAVSSRA